jgi:hypothetical protein
VGINKPFKDRVRDHYENFMVMTVDGKPKRQDVAHWIWEAWDDLTETMILNTWRHIGLTPGVAEALGDDEADMDDPLEMLDVEDEMLDDVEDEMLDVEDDQAE